MPAFGENFTIITDSPGTARTAALLLFGTASPETAPSGPDTLTSPDTIHIFQSQRYSPPPPGTMPLAYGKNPNESMLYQPSNREAFLSIPEDPRGAIRTTMLGLSAYIRNALKRRGLFFIHAAAVEISGSAAAFIGENETGKSTLARYLAARGNPLLSDDLLPVRGGGEIAVENNPAPFNPSGLPPGILDSLKQLGYNNCGYENFILPPPAPRAYPLKTAFLPRWGETTGIESAGGALALKAIYAASRTPLQGRETLAYHELAENIIRQTSFFAVSLIKGAPPPQSLLDSIEKAATAAATH